jgi:hypothetical protein
MIIEHVCKNGCCVAVVDLLECVDEHGEFVLRGRLLESNYGVAETSMIRLDSGDYSVLLQVERRDERSWVVRSLGPYKYDFMRDLAEDDAWEFADWNGRTWK